MTILSGNVDYMSEQGATHRHYPVLNPILKGTLHNTNKALNADWFGSDLAPISTPAIFRISLSMSASGIVTVKRTNGGVSVNQKLNKGAAVTADGLYVEDLIIGAGDTINFSHDVLASANVNCKVLEMINYG